MADVQILAAGSESLPWDYTVPNTQEIIPKAVSAIFDGSGASGSFYPLLEIISDGGVVVAQSFCSSVAAGGSAECSWFPRVASSGASSTQWPFAYIGYIGTGTSCTGSATTNLATTSTSFYTNASSVFGTGANHGVTGVVVKAVGHYLVTATAQPPSPPAAATLYELQIAGGAGSANFEGGTSAVAVPPGGLTDQGRVTEQLIMTAGSADIPTVPMIGQIVNSSATAVTISFLGLYVVQIDTDTTVLT